jgi:UDP-GlcNAc:undecaprenyl-phosphate/decaprenyl-phosphate GlcNAc-1-phosphate transferase
MPPLGYLALVSFATALFAALILIRLAPLIGLVDHPGGRKDHADSTPLVGGLAIFAALAMAATLGDASWILVATAAWVIVAGVADDRFEIGPLPRFIMQGCAALTMFYVAGVELQTVGRLIGFRDIAFGPLAVAFTVFCVLGVINAINMIDGLDGLSGSIAATAFAAFAYVAFESGMTTQGGTLVVLLAATIAFLALNMRLPWNARARTFLGDTGSMLIGLLIAWFAVDLTNGTGRTFAPINALWVVMIPLCDCVSLMARRRKAGRRTTDADREHLHHYFLARGFSVSRTQWTITAINAGFAVAAVVAWKFDVPQPVMFGAFVVFFLAYHRFMGRAFATSRSESILPRRP